MLTKTKKVMLQYVIVILSDEKGFSPAGAVFPWSAGKNAAAARSALSPYGEEIPTPVIGYAIPVKEWVSVWEKHFLHTGSNRTKGGYFYKMTAEQRKGGLLERLEKAHPHFFEGLSTDLSTIERNGKSVNNHGYGSEYALGGKVNTNESLFDIVLKKRFGCLYREILCQVKYMGCWWYSVDAPDGHCKRGSRGGYVAANYTDFYATDIIEI